MTDYQKTMRVKASLGALFDALTTLPGLAGWWTSVTGSGETGGELRFFFGTPDPCVVRVDRAARQAAVRRPATVHWTVTDCAFLPEWVGTRPTFTISPAGAGASELTFHHHGLTAELDCIEECTRGWDHFLESLRAYAEVGRGMPRGSLADEQRRARPA